jgi:hypothetical protein
MVVRKLLGWLNPQRLLDLAFRVRPNSELIIGVVPTGAS